MTPSEIEPVTFRIAALRLNQLRYRLLPRAQVRKKTPALYATRKRSTMLNKNPPPDPNLRQMNLVPPSAPLFVVKLTSSSSEQKAEKKFKIRYNHFLPDPLQFLIHKSSYQSMLSIWATDKAR